MSYRGKNKKNDCECELCFVNQITVINAEKLPIVKYIESTNLYSDNCFEEALLLFSYVKAFL